MLEVVVRKNNVKPGFKTIPLLANREVILPIVTTAQLSLTEFCLSFKEKLQPSAAHGMLYPLL